MLHKFVSGSLTDSGSNKRTLVNSGGSALATPPAGYAGIAGWTFTQTAVQRLTHSDNGLPSGNAPRTMGAIIRTTDAAYRTVMGYGTASGEGAFQLTLNTPIAGSGVGSVGMDTWSTSRVATPTSTAVNDGNPHLVAIQFDGDTMAIVMDGVVRASAFTGSIPTVLAGLGLGGAVSGVTTGNSFIGDMWLPFVADYVIDERDLTIASMIANFA